MSYIFRSCVSSVKSAARVWGGSLSGLWVLQVRTFYLGPRGKWLPKLGAALLGACFGLDFHEACFLVIMFGFNMG